MGRDRTQAQGARPQTVLVVIVSDLYTRNYLDSGALEGLRQDYDVHITMSSRLTLCRDVLSRHPKASAYNLSRTEQRRGQLIFDVLMLRSQDKSRSFAFRAKATCPPLWLSLRTRRPWRKVFREHVRRSWLRLLSTELAFKGFNRLFLERLPVNAGLQREIDRVNPDIVVVPSSGSTIDAIDAVKICRARGIRSLFLIDNWDNLSSKSILWEKPDHVAVWGPQSKEHAVDIQGFVPDRVSVIGTPRFDSYLAQREKTLSSHFSFPYALFVGTSLPFDEVRALQHLDEELLRHPEVYGDLRIVYRPHPWRWSKDSILHLNLQRVLLDPQMAENYARMKLSKDFQPSLDYYPALLQNASFALGGISSMLIEAAVFAKHYLVLSYDEPMNMYSPKRIFEDHVHFRGLEKLPGVLFCEDFAELAGRFRVAFEQSKRPLDFSTVDRQREYFLHLSDTPYRDRLRALVGRLLADSSSPAVGGERAKDVA